MSMALDKDGNLIAGGDPKGYVYRISPEGKAFVLYDSGMREVHSVAVGPNGTIYAAVISGEAPISPAAAPAAAGDRTSQGAGAGPTVTVTLGSTSEAAQTVDVIEPLDSVSADTP